MNGQLVDLLKNCGPGPFSDCKAGTIFSKLGRGLECLSQSQVCSGFYFISKDFLGETGSAITNGRKRALDKEFTLTVLS